MVASDPPAAVGSDEAGRGPVLGSMFVAAVRAEPSALPAGVADSKRLSPATRERLADALRASEAVSAAVSEVSVAAIDDPSTDLNALTVRGHADALAGVLRDGDDCVVDACDTDADRFARRVAARLDVDAVVRGEHRADETHAVVAAASILAKSARESHVAALAEHHGEVGSGYPSDPTTRAFLADYVGRHGELPDCARRSWRTSADVLAAAAQSALSEF